MLDFINRQGNIFSFSDVSLGVFLNQFAIFPSSELEIILRRDQVSSRSIYQRRLSVKNCKECRWDIEIRLIRRFCATARQDLTPFRGTTKNASEYVTTFRKLHICSVV